MTKGFTLLSALIAIIISAIAISAGVGTLRYFLSVNSQVQYKDDLMALRADALNRIDCAKSVVAPCTTRDKNGNAWPSATGILGRWAVSVSCGSTGITLSRRLANAESNAAQQAAMDFASSDPNNWQPLFDDKPVLCENNSITTSPNNPLPYYSVAYATATGVYGCHYADGGPNSYRGYSIYGTAVCNLGYTAVSGGNDCGSDVSAPTANLPNGAGNLWASGGYYGWSSGLCAKARSSCTFYAVCIRS